MSLLAALKAGVKVHGAPAMEALGRGIAREIFPNGGVLALQGELGAGKTTLTRGIAQALGIENITSPTFNYYLAYNGGKLPLMHVDAYRMKSAQEYESLMLEEMMQENTLMVVEWPQNVEKMLPKEALWLQLGETPQGMSENARWVKIIK